MTELGIAHVQLKGAIDKTFMVSPERALGPLAPDSVRIRTLLLGLSTNTTTYAVAGAMLHWWDCFPVTPELPSPYNDRAKYGIAPGWGFATVLESKIDSITPGTLIRGFLPLSTIPVDLCLKPANTSGGWIEKSSHRSEVMSTYQRYTVSTFTATSSSERELMANDALVGTLWGSTWLLNNFSFTTTKPFIHPAGDGLPWSAADADISNALVICLTASSKTAMSLACELRHDRSPNSGPMKLLGITSESHKGFVSAAGWHDAVLSYDEALQDGTKAIHDAANDAKRIIVIDMGARGQFTGDLQKALSASGKLPVTFIRVGMEKTTGPPEELQAIFQRSQAIGMTQMNASGLRDQAIAEVGETSVFAREAAARKAFLEKGGIPGLKISWKEGMVGPKGLEGAWNRLARNEVSAEEGIAVWMGEK